MVSETGVDFQGEDKLLKVGKQVKAFWCKDGFYYQGEGVIAQVTRSEVSVRLQQQVAWSDDFKSGQLIRIPRISDSRRWSARNCVRLPRKYALAG